MLIRSAFTIALLACSSSLAYAQPCSPNEVANIVANDGNTGDGYGWSVAIDGDIAVVGSYNDDGRGSVYVVTYDGSHWDEYQKIIGSGVRTSDSFGDSVAISGTTIVVGTPGDDDAGQNAGAAYVFELIDGTWTQIDKLIAPPVVGGDNYASAVDIDGDLIVLSASLTDSNGGNSGAAYIYQRINSVWTYQTQLVPDDNAEFDRFGIDVAISGNRVAIGADSDDDNGMTSGSAYVYTLDNGSWTQTAKLTASDGAPDDQFGERLDISGNAIIVGARYDDDTANRSGSAYIFEFNGSVWNQATKLHAFDASSSEYFGQDVAIHNNRAVVGAWGQLDDKGFFNAGGAYAFSKSDGSWSLDTKLTASDREGGDFYGYAVDVTDDHAIIGADGNDDFWWGPDAGSVYLIALNCQDICIADLNGDGQTDFLDISAFLSAYNAMQPPADLNSDGQYDFLDISAFLSAYSAGCP